MNPITLCEKIVENSQLASTRKIFGTHEWASHNANFINGCSHDCKYCYSKAMAIRFNRKSPATWKKEEIRPKSLKKKFKKLEGTIMFPSSHDITPKYLEYSLEFLKDILQPGNKVLIVSKPHYECIDAICSNFRGFKENILFRFSIGSNDSEVLEFWEPHAPTFKERIMCLKFAFQQGFKTSVSCEPMLDDNIEYLIEELLPYVTDAIWVGKINSPSGRLKLNGEFNNATVKKLGQLLDWQSDENIISLYYKYRSNSKIKWKDSIKRIVGLSMPRDKGLDI